jgi:hypothetical protein
LAIIAGDREERSKAAAASVEHFGDEVHGLLDADRLLVLTATLDRQVRGPVRVTSSRGSAPMLLATVEMDRVMNARLLRPAAGDAVRAALTAHRQHVGALATDPDAPLRRLEPILTTGELGDLAAAIRRHRPTLFAGAR